MDILAAVEGKEKPSGDGIRDDMTEQQKQLATDNHNLIYSFLTKYNLDAEEYYDLAAIGLCQAAKTYRNHIARFSTYAYRCMFNILSKEWKRKQNVGIIPEHLISSYNCKITNENDELVEYVEYIPSDFDLEYTSLLKVSVATTIKKLGLSERDLLIFELSQAGYNHTEIGKLVGCDRSTVARVQKNIMENLKGEKNDIYYI